MTDNVIQFEEAVDGRGLKDNASAFLRARAMWMDKLNASDVSDSAYRVGCWIAFRMDTRPERNGFANSFYSQQQIADELGVSRRKVIRAVKELKNKGYISVESGKTGTANTYRLRQI
jgi:CRP-like cAMP-binding protein